MRARWTSSDVMDSPELDAYADWLGEIGGTSTGPGIADTYWTPFVLLIPPVLHKAEVVFNLIMNVFVKAKQNTVSLNPHDLAHWMITARTNPKCATELILLVASDGETTGVATILAELKKAAGALETLHCDQDIRVIGQGAALQGVAPSADLELRDIFDEVKGLIEGQRSQDQPAGSNADQTPLVITAIIDHAIPFANERFETPANQSRFAKFWAQGTQVVPHPVLAEGDGQANALDPVLGVQISQGAINGALGALQTDTTLTERDLYTQESMKPLQSAGAMRPAQRHRRRRGDSPLALSTTHGAQMLDIAAGDHTASLRSDQTRILAVELPAQLVARTNGFMHEPYVKSAMNWIWFQLRFDDALKNRPNRSVIVNYSFGDNAGRRDQQAALDADFQLRLDRGEVDMINVPAGNNYLLDCHAQLDDQGIAEEEALELWVQPDTKTATLVQMWLNEAYEGGLPFKLQITDPSGHQSDAGILGMALDAAGGEKLARVYVQNKTPLHPLPCKLTTKARTCITVALRPTASYDPEEPVAAAGLWVLQFAPLEGGETALKPREVLDIWVERNDSVAGFPIRGRQAYFNHPGHNRILEDSGRMDEALITDSPIKRSSTSGANANADDVFVAGAFRGVRGPIRTGPYTASGSPRQPNFALVVEDSGNRPNMITSGSISGSASMVRGTSAAAAMATRIAVDILLENPSWIGSSDARHHVENEMKRRARNTEPTEPYEVSRVGTGVLIGTSIARAWSRFEG